MEGEIFTDDRGHIRFFNNFNFQTAGIKRFYQVENYQANFVRAWHGHKEAGTYVYVAKGSILLGAIPLNTEPHRLEDLSQLILSANKPTIVYIAPGHYNGFKNLTKNTIVQFFSTMTLEEMQSAGESVRAPWHNWDIWGVKFR